METFEKSQSERRRPIKGPVTQRTNGTKILYQIPRSAISIPTRFFVHGEHAPLSAVPCISPGLLHRPARPAPAGRLRRRVPARRRHVRQPRRGPPSHSRRRQGVRLLPGKQVQQTTTPNQALIHPY